MNTRHGARGSESDGIWTFRLTSKKADLSVEPVHFSVCTSEKASCSEWLTPAYSKVTHKEGRKHGMCQHAAPSFSTPYKASPLIIPVVDMAYLGIVASFQGRSSFLTPIVCLGPTK